MFDYEKLWKQLKKKDLKKNDLKKYVGLTPSTLAKLNKNKNVSMETLDRLCTFLECDIGDIVEHVYTPYKLDYSLGTFSLNKSENIHNWFSYLEGYSYTLVETELKQLKGINSLLDPFGGSGTTPLVGVFKGIQSYYCETNPVMAYITKVKTETAFIISRNINLINELEIQINEVINYLKGLSYSDEDCRINFGGFEKYFENKNLFYIKRYQQYVNEKVKKSEIKDILLVALAGVAVNISKMIRRGDLRYAKGKELIKTNKNFIIEIEKKLHRMFSDIIDIKKINYGNSILLTEDCRDIEEENIVDAVITSPPYLNGTNYTRNTKLELKLLGFVEDEKDLSHHHRKGIVAGINNVNSDINDDKVIPQINRIIEELNKVSYDSRIQKMIISYFNDMNDVFISLSKAIRDGGYLIMDIGDSQFAGIHIPTHEILIELAKNCRFELYDEEIIRSRKSKNGFELTQRILRFRLNKNEMNNNIKDSEDYERNAKEFLSLKSYQEKGRNWGHSWHSLCSYRGKLKPAIAHELVERFTEEGDIVLDPMGGVGTIPFEACLQNRIGISNDLSELAYIVSKAKVQKPDYHLVLDRIKELDDYIELNKSKFENNSEVREFGLNKKIIDYFHPETMKEILAARQFFLDSDHNEVDCVVESCILHILHGNRPYALSRTSHSLTPYAPKGEFVYKNLIEHLIKKIDRSYNTNDILDRNHGSSFNMDISDLPYKLKVQADVIISSPPFASSFKFYTQNWMRLRFTGWTQDDFIFAKDRFYDDKQNKDMDIYYNYFEICNRLLKKKGKLILHLGKSNKVDMSKELISRCSHWFDVIYKGDEYVSGESFGVVDKGATTAHQFLFLQKK